MRSDLCSPGLLMPTRSFSRFVPSELRLFLDAVDSFLTESVDMIIIGGSALTLGYGVETATSDVDTFETDLNKINPAIEAARQKTGLNIPVDANTVADIPYNYRERVQRVLPELENLVVLVPDRYDLALSKLVRATEHDFAGIEELHAAHPLDIEILVSRYLDEMNQAVTDLRVLDQKFLICVRSLFGELRYIRIKKRVEERRRQPR